jgi:hypothetical protein
MSLIACAECDAKISSESLSCPKCGKPNKRAVHKKQNGAQGAGMLLILLAIPLGYFIPVAGIVAFVFGLVIVLMNTRFW